MKRMLPVADTDGVLHPAIPTAALALATATCMAVYVGSRRDKGELHWLLLVLLASLMVWTGGSVLRFTATDLPSLERALRVVFFGIFFTPPLWLLLAARYSQSPAFQGRRELWLELVLPSLVAYAAFLTNDQHHLVLKETSFEALGSGGMAWAGPVFWVWIAWAYACVFGGVLLYLKTAKNLVRGNDRNRGIILGCASFLPVLTSAAYMIGIVPFGFDLTPSALTVTVSLLCVAVFRYQLLESLPLARRDVIEQLQDGVLMASRSGLVLDMNPAAERILGRRAREIRRTPLSSALAGLGDGQGIAALHAGLSQLLEDSPPLVAEVRTRDDRRVEVQVSWVRGAQGAPAGQFALLSDRTEERRYERIVRQTQKLRTMGTLAAGIAHEVNNPLAFIRANLGQILEMGERVEAALDAGGPDAKLAEELVELSTIGRETVDGIERIEQIVAGMRRLSSPREGNVEPLDLNDVVDDAVRLSNLAREGALELRVRKAPRLPRVQGTPERLVQAILNLLLNAFQALDGASGTIWLETLETGSQVEVVVRDDGPGVPEEIQERIFDPFFTTKDPDRGTGLGLAIAFDILRDHGGVLELRASEGGGACFVACFPV